MRGAFIILCVVLLGKRYGIPTDEWLFIFVHSTLDLMQRVRVEVCAVSFYLNCYYFYALTFVISIVCGFLYAACERVCNNTSLSISFIFHISHCAQASAACVCVCHWPSCAVRFIFVCDTLCGDHINIPKYCNNFALSILFDFPLAVVGLFCIYILKR